MQWEVVFYEVFDPRLGRPRADTLKGSKHANMKELRFDAEVGVWRVAFADAHLARSGQGEGGRK